MQNLLYWSSPTYRYRLLSSQQTKDNADMVVDVVETVVSSGTVVSAADVVVSRVVEPPADVVVVSGKVAGSISKVEVVPSEAFNDACVLVVPATTGL
jgi:hypothetical protein